MTLESSLGDTVRQARQAFLTELEPLRPDLFRYCRGLTGDPFEAEDLVQETLARAFARLADVHHEIRRPRAWLFRIATHAAIDLYRRRLPIPAELGDRPAAGPAADPAEVRDALAEVAAVLPPQERAVLVLKDVFELPLAEIAELIGTSVGAVKTALHRARGKLPAGPGPGATGATGAAGAAAAARPRPSRALVDQLAAAFTAYDLDRLAALFLTDGVSTVIGQVHETGRERARSGSLRHTLEVETHVRYRAEVRELDGEPVVLLWATPAGGGPEAVEDLLRVTEADGGIAELRWYYFCPDTLTEIGARLGVPVRTNGYHLG